MGRNGDPLRTEKVTYALPHKQIKLQIKNCPAEQKC